MLIWRVRELRREDRGRRGPTSTLFSATRSPITYMAGRERHRGFVHCRVEERVALMHDWYRQARGSCVWGCIHAMPKSFRSPELSGGIHRILSGDQGREAGIPVGSVTGSAGIHTVETMPEGVQQFLDREC